jgi:hypothetical protein
MERTGSGGRCRASVRFSPRGDPECRRVIAAPAAAPVSFARSISHAPTSTIGTDSNCPMVAPAKRKPRCASGWRNSSPTSRAAP